MNVVLFGATGMVGQGVLRECLLDPQVDRIVSIVRSVSGMRDPKLEEIVHPDFYDLSAIEEKLTGLDACLYTLGVSSAGMSEEAYRRVTYDMTMAAAQLLVKRNPKMTFLYVSGAGTDSTESGSSMWARVKGKTENDLLKMPFKAAYMLRPGIIRPLDGIVSKTQSYRILYALLGPLLPVLRKLFPKYVTTTRQVGLAMLRVAREGYRKAVLESAAIDEIANQRGSLTMFEGVSHFKP